MKYIILETLFGWLCRPILLWTGTDILTILAEIFIIATIINVVINMRSDKNERNFKSKTRNNRSGRYTI